MSKAMLDASDPHAWLGHLSATVGFYLYGSLTRRDVEKAYTAYRQSPCVDDELRAMLPGEEAEQLAVARLTAGVAQSARAGADSTSALDARGSVAPPAVSCVCGDSDPGDCCDGRCA